MMQTDRTTSPLSSAIREFIRLESAGGLLLLAAAVAAVLIANSPFTWIYDALLDTTVAVQVGALAISKPLLLWINDGLMAVFFFLIGLEVKREFLEGELSTPAQIVLPGVGALGGMAVPAAIYAAFNWNDPVALDGWGIPVATDIAFAILPLFAFANAGLSLSGFTIDSLIHPVTLGIIAGLFLGKPIGIVGFVGIAVLSGWVRLPPEVTWARLVGVSLACGIGFTMSLFIAGLAFEHGSGAYFAADRLGVVVGSLAAAVMAWLVLRASLCSADEFSS